MKCLLFTFAIALIGCLVASDSQTENELVKKYLENLAQTGYNTHVRPISSNGHGKPIDLKCTMYLLDIYEVDDVNMEYTAEFYFRQSWNDSRLAYSDQDIKKVELNDVKHIWTPDLFFVQEKRGIRHSLITPNVFIRISKTGEVLYSVRLSLTFSCPMDFRNYPHDTQKCTFQVESYGMQRSQMELSWSDIKTPVMRNMDIDLLPFRLTDMKENVKHVTMSSGEYSVLQVELTFQRKIGFFVTRLYIPFIFLIVLSWLSFRIPAKLVLPRLSLLLVLMYFMVHIGYDINVHAPKSSYTKGSDVWIAVCESLVFASFLEFIVVHIIARNKDKLQKRLCKNDPEARNVLDSDSKVNPVSSEPSNGAVSMIANRLKRDVLLSSRIDKISNILFPVLFIFFNFVYWLVYCTGQ